jgi:uncharacterized membrane protein
LNALFDINTLHPKIVHFPVALFLSAAVFELVSLLLKKESIHRTALHVYILAALSAPLALITGLIAEDAAHVHHYLLERHELCAYITLCTSWTGLLVLWIVSKKAPQYSRKVFLIFTLVLAAVVLLTGYYGGRMVYEYGIGVQP